MLNGMLYITVSATGLSVLISQQRLINLSREINTLNKLSTKPIRHSLLHCLSRFFVVCHRQACIFSQPLIIIRFSARQVKRGICSEQHLVCHHLPATCTDAQRVRVLISFSETLNCNVT